MNIKDLTDSQLAKAYYQALADGPEDWIAQLANEAVRRGMIL